MIAIPAWAWKAVVDRFAETGGVVERVAFLDGVASGPAAVDGGVVTTVTLPHADESDSHWDVDAHEMSRAGRHLRAHGLVRLAQVHSHPGSWAGHSEEDDELAYSQAPGTVSIVLPAYGLTCPGLGDAGVHVREARAWRRLDRDEVHGLLTIVPSLLDLRYT